MIINGWQLEMNLSIVEIYNEELRDLLTTPTSANNSKDKLKIVKQQNKIFVQNLTQINLPCMNNNADGEDFQDCMNIFNKFFKLSQENRITANNGMNEFSSRSHLIVMVDIMASMQSSNGANSSSTVLYGGLRLCDLAGSERLDRTSTLTDQTRLRETVNINKSLSCLADVFISLHNKSSHIPYRNSKLTMLLQVNA
jgi:hypothetical protein